MLAIVSAALTALGTTLVWGFVTGKWTTRIDLELAAQRALLDRAGAKQSDLANQIQGLEERLREEFVTRREWELIERRHLR